MIIIIYSKNIYFLMLSRIQFLKAGLALPFLTGCMSAERLSDAKRDDFEGLIEEEYKEFSGRWNNIDPFWKFGNIALHIEEASARERALLEDLLGFVKRKEGEKSKVSALGRIRDILVEKRPYGNTCLFKKALTTGFSDEKARTYLLIDASERIEWFRTSSARIGNHTFVDIKESCKKWETNTGLAFSLEKDTPFDSYSRNDTFVKLAIDYAADLFSSSAKSDLLENGAKALGICKGAIFFEHKRNKHDAYFL